MSALSKLAQRNQLERKHWWEMSDSSPQTEQWGIMGRFQSMMKHWKACVCVLYWLLHRWGEGSVHCDSVRLQTHRYSWCTHLPPTVHYSDTPSPGTNTTPPSLQHKTSQTRRSAQHYRWRLSLFAECDTLTFIAAFPRTPLLFLTFWTNCSWTLLNAALDVAQLSEDACRKNRLPQKQMIGTDTKSTIEFKKSIF